VCGRAGAAVWALHGGYFLTLVSQVPWWGEERLVGCVCGWELCYGGTRNAVDGRRD